MTQQNNKATHSIEQNSESHRFTRRDFLILLGFVIAAALVLLVQSRQGNEQNEAWRTYKNTEFGFTFQYPASYTVQSALSSIPEGYIPLVLF